LVSLDVRRHGYRDVVTTTPNARRGVRLHEANREQLSWGRIDLDAQLSEDHAARAIWAVVLALLMGKDLVDLTRVAQDGTRILASAGASRQA
jgi:hypothetical protein